MKKQTFNEEMLFNYVPSEQTYIQVINLHKKLHEMDFAIRNVFFSDNMASRIFAFIESKYSSKIEGIYTTLFDVVNTGIETKQQKLIRPLVETLFNRDMNIDTTNLLKLEDVMNSGISKAKRFDNNFGIYKQVGKNKIKIYTPPMDKSEVTRLLNKIITKTETDVNLIQMIHSHIIFEKIHPFVDANGRLGRLIFQKSISKSIAFTYVLPVSWSFYRYLSEYYEVFDINNKEDIDKSVQKMMNIIGQMIKNIYLFLDDVKKYIDNNVDIVKNSSQKMTKRMAYRILLTLQTKSTYLNKKYGLNPKTITRIFDNLNKNDLPFNVKTVNRQKAFWNIELEQIIDKHFN